LLRNKIKTPREKWIRKLKDGLVVFLGDTKAPRGKTIPQFLSITDCIDLVAFMILNTFGHYPPAGKNIQDPPYQIKKRVPTADELEFFSWSMEILCVLQQICTHQQKLLPSSPVTRVVIRYVSIRIMTESMAWLEAAAMSSEKPEVVSEKLALESFLHACSLLNQFAEGDLAANNLFAKQVAPEDSNAQENGAAIPRYSYLWVDKLYLPCYSARLLSWLTQSVILALRHPVPTNEAGSDAMDVDNDTEELALLYWSCIEKSATLFFACCFVDLFVTSLVADPHCDQLLLAIDNILRLPPTEEAHINRAKYVFLKVLVALSENDEPYFLDYASKIQASYSVAGLVSREAARVLEYVELVMFIDETSDVPSSAVVAREALRVAELLSYDSNFVKLVTENLTQFILEYLSFPPERFALFFQVENSFPQYVTALIFRIIANLHCYNPSVSPPDQKHYLINKIYYFFTTIFVPNAEGEITRTSNLIIANIATNLWILFQRVTELFSFTLQELELWRSFMGELQRAVNLIFPPPTGVQATAPARVPVAQQKPRPPPRPTDDEYFTESDLDDEELEDDADEFVLAPAVKPANIKDSLPAVSTPFPIDLSGPTTCILQGLSVCFGVVPDPEGLKNLITLHGGSVIGYVTKTVTHVICGHDLGSVEASASKIQSAEAKQVPVVSEKLIHDSIKEGRLLHERAFLVASHSYLRRVKTA